MATVKDKSSQTRTSQLEVSTMIVNKLDEFYCDSKKLVKETLSQMNRSEFREHTTEFRLKTIYPIYVKPLTVLFNKYTVLSCEKNMYHC